MTTSSLGQYSLAGGYDPGNADLFARNAIIIDAPRREHLDQAIRRLAAGPGGPGYSPQLDFEHGQPPSLAVMSASTMKVLVTGGTSGLGLAMASALAAAGARVALTSRSAAQAVAVAAELPGAAGLEMDVREESSVALAVGQAGRGWAASTRW